MLTVSLGLLGSLAAPPAWAALPSEQADATYMTNGQVRAVAAAGGHIWIGGQFDRLLTPSGAPGPAAPGIAVLDGSTGAPSAGVTLPALQGNPFVYDFAARGNILYVAGRFTYRGGAKTYKNLVALDATTGRVLTRFSTPVLRCVAAFSRRVLAGGARLTSYRTTGKVVKKFKPLVPRIDPTIRNHKTPSKIRDIGVADGQGYAVGQFDSVNGDPQKMAVKFNPFTGVVQNWHVAKLNERSAAFGIALEIVGGKLYVGAGGSDFTAVYALSNGRQYWKTDTSGSTQTLTLWDANTLVIGGHFKWIQLGNSGSCGDNANPNPSCFHQPRLAVLDSGNGHVDTSWTPVICCAYNGLWALAAENGHLHVAGQFTKIGTRSQSYYGRLS